MNFKQVLVSGATNQVGVFLLPRLIAAGFHVHALSRRDSAAHKPQHERIIWHQADLDIEKHVQAAPQASYFFHLAPIWLALNVIEKLSEAGVRRIVALSSTSRFSKLNSQNISEKNIVEKLIAAEAALINKCDKYNIEWTLLRPTMIYGCGMDKNVTVIAKFIKKFSFFPLVGPADGLRQPLHADDLAGACLAAMNSAAAVSKAYNLSGGQTLKFREMVEEIFRAQGKKPRIVFVPRSLVSFLITCARIIPAYRHINMEMMVRVNSDICFDSSDASRDFGYAPRGFKYE